MLREYTEYFSVSDFIIWILNNLVDLVEAPVMEKGLKKCSTKASSGWC